MASEDGQGGGAGGKARSIDQAAVDVAIRLGFIALFAWVSLQLIAPFAGVLAWAVVLCVATYPVHAWLTQKLGGRGGWSATLLTLLGLAIVLGPAAVLMLNLAESVQGLTEKLHAGTLKLPPPPEGVADWPLIGQKADQIWRLMSSNLAAGLQTYAQPITEFLGSALGAAAGLGGGVLLFAVSIIIAGVLYGPGPALAGKIRAFASRLAAPRGAEFVDMAGATIRNVSRGVIGVSLIQALLAGIGMTAAGVPAAGALAFVVLILGIIQVGPAIIILPVVIWSWTAMDTATAAIFTAYMIPVMIMDNFLKPVLMARGLQTPMLVIFIGVIGGTFAFGLLGLFFGPVVLAVFYELLLAWVSQAGKAPDEAAEGEGEGAAA